jgi:hypothetical protein
MQDYDDVPFSSFTSKANALRQRLLHETSLRVYDIDSRSLPRPINQKHRSAEWHLFWAEKAELVTQDTLCVDAKGEPLLAYLPAYLDVDRELPSVASIEQLMSASPPAGPYESPADVRHCPKSPLPGELKLPCRFKNRYGTYHFAVWHESVPRIERPRPIVSLDTLVKKGGTHRYSAVASFLHTLEPLTNAMSIAYAAVHPEGHKRCVEMVQSLTHQLPAASHVSTARVEPWSGRAVLANVYTHCHVDLKDLIEALAGIACFGKFKRGDFVVPSLGLKFLFRPGDVIFIQGVLLEHFVTPWDPDGESGSRYSIVHFNHQSVADWVSKRSGPAVDEVNEG